MKTSVAVLLAASLLASSDAMCPNRCSEHGVCGAFDRCTCYDGWTFGDCSGRVCPYGNAWADVVDSTVTGRTSHYYAECSGKGLCNRETGLCECLDGFEGKSCQRLSCPEGCSGHGTCNLLGEVESGLSTWDASKIQVCVCDAGWTGYACQERMCKKGDDPMSVHDSSGSNTEVDEVQTVSLVLGANNDAGATFLLEYTDWSGESYKTHPIEFPPTVFAVQEALEALPNNAIPSVTVAVTENTPNQDYDIAITFSDSANAGDQPMLAVYAGGCTEHGCQPVYAGVTHSGGTAATTASVVETTKGTAERVECSNRGICNVETGNCECFEGFFGDACNQQTIIM